MPAKDSEDTDYQNAADSTPTFPLGGPQADASDGDAPTLHRTAVSASDGTLHLPPKSSVRNKADLQAGSGLRYFGEYELVPEIARGGMGVVFKARQINLNRVVALKMILSGQLASEEDVQRFKTEAEAAANLDHPGIVPIFDIGEHDGQHYFSMGFVEGKSLADLVSTGPLSAERAAGLTEKICEAMAYAHQRDVIHRDLKPANILLDLNSQPKVTDFGLAKKTSADSNLTGTGQILGTPSYMAPEQASGKVDEVGPLADVYALGAILYCLLTGRPPFQAANPLDTLLQVLDKPPLPPRQLNSAVPVDLETICLKCLNKDPSKRYASAGALAEELARFQNGEPILARPVTRIERGWLWARRHPALAFLMTAVMLLTATLAIGGPLAAINQSKLKSSALANEKRATALAEMEAASRLESEKGKEALAIEKNKSDQALYARSISLAYELFRSANLMGAEQTLASLPFSKRGFEWDFVNGLCKSELHKLAGVTTIPSVVALTSDGNHAIAAQHGGAPKLFVWKLGAALPIEVRNVEVLAISHDGDKVALVDPSNPAQVKVTESVTGKVLAEFSGVAEWSRFSAFGGDNDSLLASVCSDNTTRVWDTNSGKQLAMIESSDREK